MITLQFSTTHLLGSLLIRTYSWSWASHVDFVLPDGNLLGAIASCKKGGSGVKIHPMKPVNTYKRVERYTIDAPSEVLEIALDQVGKSYDWGALFGFLAKKRNWQSTDKWFCSELVAYAFSEAGYPIVNEDAYRITPRDLLISPLLKKVEVDFIGEYKCA